MFSDTHFHFPMMQELGYDGTDVLNQMAARDCYFGLDIGTRADDLERRQSVLENAINKISDIDLQKKAKKFIFFSAGIWPDVDSIHNRFECIKQLEESIKTAEMKQTELNHKIVAIGEGGIDHHWNPSGVDGRCESDFDQKTYEAERELFQMQLELSKNMDLPMIVHSRDGFEDTLDCIKNIGWNKGIIHCYSYGLEEARAFLDLGWYISLSGGVTYTKKSKMEEMVNLLRYIPEDRILCETDSPYLAPVPHRGEKNCPVYVQHVYEFVASARNTTPVELSKTVDKNIQQLFFPNGKI